MTVSPGRALTRDRLPVIYVARRDHYGEQLPVVVDHQVDFEAVEPTCAGLATFGQFSKDLVRLDPQTVKDRPGAAAETQLALAANVAPIFLGMYPNIAFSDLFTIRRSVARPQIFFKELSDHG